MECWIETWDGRKERLPQALEWTFSYGVGTPCDSFTLQCTWGESRSALWGEGVTFWAEEGGERLFTGRLDEVETSWDARGGLLTLCGRGMAALLLDNETVGAQYQAAVWEDIRRGYVEPYGIRCTGGESLRAVEGFTVENGASAWTAVETFVHRCNGVEPWFDRQGVLHLDGWRSGTERTLSGKLPLISAVWREKRYGVLSEVLVRDRMGTVSQTVRNESFLARGGRCRQVLTLPGTRGYEVMRYSGSYQIGESAREQEVLTLRLAGTGAAWVGDRLNLDMLRPRLTGCWRVRACETGVGREGGFTELKLIREE